MRISINWLRDFVEIQDSPQVIADRLTLAGLEVDSVVSLQQGFDKLVVGRILTVEAHPDSDHLTICRVDAGGETLQIVCGARNHREGNKVVLALPGAVLPGGVEIVPSNIRGVRSSGMICSAKELGIPEESSGVMILPEDAEVGRSAAEVLGRNDTVLEIDLTPNRSDCLSHFGVARELAGLTGECLKRPEIKIQEEGPSIDSWIAVTIRDAELCPRYTARMILDVTIGPSPRWLRNRLCAVGLRPVNNVVDVTNYIMMERGHPLHAFDYDKIEGRRIEVRTARPGDVLKTLDGVERTLDSSMLLICDGKNPVAVAGVMGGENTEVDSGTKRIFLEAACFQPVSIRRTSKRLGLHSESSHRFERGIDIEGLVDSLDRAAALIQEVAGGRIAKGRIDHYPAPYPTQTISLRTGRVRSLLGISISSDEIKEILTRLSLTVENYGDDRLEVRIPSFRNDLTREIDLIEEVARFFGYDRIPTTLPNATLTSGKRSGTRRVQSLCRSILIARGFFETIHYSFQSPEDLDRLLIPEGDPLRAQIRIRNPLSEDQSVLRTLLLPGLLHTLNRNLAHSVSDIRIFEIGRIFQKRNSGLPLESGRLAGLLSGKNCPLGWGNRPRAFDFFDLKGVLEELFEAVGLIPVQWSTPEDLPFLHPGRSAWMAWKEEKFGFAGEVHPEVLKRFGLSEKAFCFELNLDFISEHFVDTVLYTSPIRFPFVDRDLALILSEEVSAGEVEEKIRAVAPDLIREVRLFDVYRGEPIAEGKKSLAYSIRFQASDRTLTDQEINGVRDRIVEELNQVFGATLRE